jgi:hypothetical protein
LVFKLVCVSIEPELEFVRLFDFVEDVMLFLSLLIKPFDVLQVVQVGPVKHNVEHKQNQNDRFETCRVGVFTTRRCYDQGESGEHYLELYGPYKL